MINAYNDLKNIIRSYLLKEKLDKIASNTKDLYNLSLSLNVPCVIGYTLKNNNQYDPIFDKSIYKSLNRYTSFQKCRDTISVLFSNEKIKYIFLKGATIAKYYVEPYLRYSSDVDLIIHKDDYDRALSLLTDKLSFVIKKHLPNEMTLLSPEGVSIDFHRTFEYEKEEFEKIFENCFDNNELDINYKYVHLLEHQAKHFVRGILELRFFIDLFYLRDKINKEKVGQLLDKIELRDFDLKLNSYLDYILLLHEPTDIDLKIEQYILSYAKDQGASNRVNNSQNKAFYFINHAFPSYKIMKGVYPILEKYPVLLPWYYIVRIVKMLKSDRRHYVADEFKGSISDSKSSLINELGISSYNK